MKLAPRRRYKIPTLLVGSSCLVLGLIFIWRQLQCQLEDEGSSDEAGRKQSESSEQYDLNQLISNKSVRTFKYYEPMVKFNEQSLENLKSMSHREKSSSGAAAKDTTRYMLQPEGNVIDCKFPDEPYDEHREVSTKRPLRAETSLFIVINSRVDNFERRRRLRDTWLNKQSLDEALCSSSQLTSGARVKRVEWVFALGHMGFSGIESSTTVLDRRLDEESRMYGDLLQFDLLESYRNMTRKHLAIFKWFLERSDPKIGRQKQMLRTILLKCDDDAQLDVAQMISRYAMETEPSSSSNTNLLMCARFQENSLVLRKFNHRTTKWSLSHHEWPYDTFPSYCSGLAYLASLELVEKLHLIAPLVDQVLQPTLWIDDVYVTGVLLAALDLEDLKLVRLNPYFCYTEAQRLHRESLEPGVRCMAAELRD